MNRGHIHSLRKNYEAAIRDYDEAIADNGKNALAYAGRAHVEWIQKRFDAAIDDSTKAIELDPNLTEAYVFRALNYDGKGDQVRTIADAQRAISLKGNQVHMAYNELAWIRATSTAESLRNGAEAVDAATQACELTHWEFASYLGTLAAAYAEKGDFDKAIEMQERALTAKEISPEFRAVLEGHLKQLQEHRPIREAPKGK